MRSRQWNLLALLVLVLAVIHGAWQHQPGFRAAQQGATYKEARPQFWNALYADGGRTLYCEQRFSSRHGREINIEHVFPMSWVMKSLQCADRQACRRTSRRFNQIEADMHNMYPALAKVNKQRSAMAYDLIDGEQHYYPDCDFEIDFHTRRVEPAPQARGRIARAMLYMADSYNLELYPRQKKLLLQWHRSHPPNREERLRNQRIRDIQGKANPYIPLLTAE
jgi:deoxyribonuclease I